MVKRKRRRGFFGRIIRSRGAWIGAITYSILFFFALIKCFDCNTLEFPFNIIFSPAEIIGQLISTIFISSIANILIIPLVGALIGYWIERTFFKKRGRK